MFLSHCYKLNNICLFLPFTPEDQLLDTAFNFLIFTFFSSHPCTLAPTSASLSPDIVETTEPAVVGVSQLEGSPMDTSSPASATQEEPATNPAQTVQLSQELSGSGESGLTDRQTDAETG